MDADLLRRADDGPVVITALAGAPGREYRTAGDNGVRHFRSLGAQDVVVAPDVREDEAGALEALRRARLLVLPGGSPSRLLAALQDDPRRRADRDAARRRRCRRRLQRRGDGAVRLDRPARPAGSRGDRRRARAGARAGPARGPALERRVEPR